MEGTRLSIRYALSALRPTPQRLRVLLAAFAQWGYSGVFLDWCGSFPWGIDDRFHASDAYRDDFVAGLVREARGRGITLESVFPAPDALPFVARVRSYRHLFRRESTAPVLELDTPAGRGFYSELIDDYLRLLPEASTMLIDCRPDSVPVGLLARVVRPFRDRGLRIVAAYRGSAARLSEEITELLEGFDLVALPASSAGAFPETHRGRLLSVVAIPTDWDPLPVSGPPGGSEGTPLLLSFQSDESDREPGGGALLGESIEGSLDLVRSAAARLGAADAARTDDTGSEGAISSSGLSELDRRLEEILAEGWRIVRLARESLRGGSEGSDEDATRSMLQALAEAYRQAGDLLRDARLRLLEVVEAPRLDRQVRKLLGALLEEHLELCGRAGIIVGVDLLDAEERRAP